MDNKRLESLMDSYLQGESSIAEEQLLREYFASPDAKIPYEFLYAKALFGYMDVAAAENCPPAKCRRRINPLLRVARIALPLAAAVVLAFLLVPSYDNKTDRIAYCYVNGQPVYDLEFAETQAELAILTLSSTFSSTLQIQNRTINNLIESLINN